jgi:hypothetical protein
MMRQLGKILALAAMMVSIVNAQCAISCSLQSFGGGLIIHGTTHACCPHGSAPAQAPDKTCPHPVLSHNDEARVEASSGALSLYDGIEAALTIEPARELLPVSSYNPVDPRPAAGRFLPSVTILRI